MRKELRRRLEAHQRVSALLKIIKSSLPSALQARAQYYIDLVESAASLSPAKGQGSHGATEVKSQNRRALEKPLLSIGSALQLYLEDQGEDEKASTLLNRQSDIDGLPAQELKIYAEMVVAEITGLTALNDYGVTAADRTALTEALNGFESKRSGPQTVISDLKNQRGDFRLRMAELLKYSRGPLVTMWNAVKDKFPEEYAKYKEYNRVIDPGTRSKEEEPTPPPAG